MKSRLVIVATLTLLLAPWLGVARGLWVGSAASAQESPDAGLIVELEFAGDDDAVELPLESVDPISLTFIDIADPRVLLNVINGCDLNDRFWVFAANLSDTPATLTITATERGSSRTFSLPAREPGRPADAIVGLEALPICSDIDGSSAGISPLEGTAHYTGVAEGCSDESNPLTLIPRGRDRTFREFRLGDGPALRVISNEPVVVIDDSGSRHEIILFAEARLPGRVEGVAIRGSAKMLPGRQALLRRLSGMTNGRVRRAFEAAVNGRVPRGLIDELGIRQIECVHHVRLEFADADASDRLFAAGWLKEDPEIGDVAVDDAGSASDGGATVADPVTPTDEDGRFIIEVVDADGRIDEIPLLSPPSERDSAIRSWAFHASDSLVWIVDVCDYTDSFWALAGSKSESEFELIILDLKANESKSYQVAQALGGSLAPAVADTQAFLTCP
jgi:hypothetical protein